MLLKRVYDHEASRDQWTPRYNDRGVEVDRIPPLKAIKLLHAGPRQNFSPSLIEGAIAEGWVAMGDGQIVLRTEPPASYRIVRVPGYYCCHCQKKLEDGPSGKTHVEAVHAGQTSPDPGNPSGYRRDNFYACERVEGPTTEKVSGGFFTKLFGRGKREG